MAENLKEHVIATVKSLMKPIIMLLLRNGVTYKEFALLCKSIFVEAAAEDYGIRGRPTNISRISVLTGIDRKEVKRIKDLLQENTTALDAQNSQDRITRILTAWHSDAEFSNNQREPQPLEVEGDQASFNSLVQRFGGDVPKQALLKEMLRVGVIERLDDGRVIAKSRFYFPAQSDPQALLRAGAVISELGETLFHNLYMADDSKTAIKFQRRFERRASNNLIDAKYKKAYYAYLEKEGQEFLERIDAWLSEHECKQESKNKSSETVRLGAGVFAIEKSSNKMDDENA